MSRTWYDIFALFYDRALQDLYAPFRPAAVEALRLSSGMRVLDLPCGTGQSFDLLAPAVGRTGSVLAVDASTGMLRKARRRVERAGWTSVELRQAIAADVGADLLVDALDAPEVDGILCALGLTALPEWEAAFERLFSLLRPGGRFVLFDVYAPEQSWESRSVELVARADLSREAWRPLETECVDFKRMVLPADVKKFGGELYVASGTKRPPSSWKSCAEEDRVVISPYNPDWPRLYAEEARIIRRTIDNQIEFDIEHFGSTAVPGLAAKPVIDLMIITGDRSVWRRFIAPLEALGYLFWAENPRTDRMFFVKGMPPFGSRRTHHVHVRAPDDAADALLFRDYLRTHPLEAKKYERLKRVLAEKHAADREAYTDAKEEYVLEIVTRARAEVETNRRR